MSLLSRLRKKQSANRNVIDGLFVKANATIRGGTRTDNDVKGVGAYLQTVKHKEKEIKETGDKILDLVEEEEIESVIEESALFDVKIAKEISIMEAYLMEKVEDDSKPSIGRNVEEFVDLKKTTVSLPKIIIKKFCGEPTAWQEFHDTFGATVGENNKLSDIEKFTYLKGYLSGEAERCIEGLELTKDNYREALEILEDA